MFGRLLHQPVTVKDATFSSKAYGKRESHESGIPGRVTLDAFQIIQRDHKLRSYSLNAVSAEFLSMQVSSNFYFSHQNLDILIVFQL